MENDLIETGFEIKLDLSEHMDELKKLIVKAMIDKFFLFRVMGNFWKVVT